MTSPSKIPKTNSLTKLEQVLKTNPNKTKI